MREHATIIMNQKAPKIKAFCLLRFCNRVEFSSTVQRDFSAFTVYRTRDFRYPENGVIPKQITHFIGVATLQFRILYPSKGTKKAA